MATTCNCCGCVLTDGDTSLVSGSGSSGDPYKLDIVDPLFSEQRYTVRRQRSTNQSIPSGTLTSIDFTTAAAGSFDRAPFFTAPSTFTIPSTGIYMFGGTVAFADSATGIRYVDIINTTTGEILAVSESNSNSGAAHYVTVSASAPLYANQTVSMRVRHTAGAPLNIVVDTEQSPVFWATYVGRFI
jgi:hypothetical protein